MVVSVRLDVQPLTTEVLHQEHGRLQADQTHEVLQHLRQQRGGEPCPGVHGHGVHWGVRGQAHVSVILDSFAEETQ